SRSALLATRQASHAPEVLAPPPDQIFDVVLNLVLVTYGAVFVAEIVGDKLLYTTGVLATRYRSASVVLGMALAFMCKMAVAVAIAGATSQLPRPLVAAVT